MSPGISCALFAGAGKYVVPVFWDKEKKTIVSNESSDITEFLNSAFNDFAKNASLDLYPVDLRKEIDALDEWIYPNVNNGVYRCGFAQAQGPYEEAFRALFKSLDRIEEILQKQRYLAGNRFTIADIRAYMTLIRFDPVSPHPPLQDACLALCTAKSALSCWRKPSRTCLGGWTEFRTSVTSDAT
jgi:glutathionyl-hydroquinone reductase